jgi:hypothetical protein
MKPIVFSAAAVAALGLAGWLAFRSGAGTAEKTADTVQQAAPRSAATTPSTPSAAAPATTTPSIAPSVRPDLNANVASVAEAARTGKHPERLSPLMAPKPFDPAAFAANPQAYLDVVEPGRVFQSAEPGVDVPVLSPKGTASYEIPVGGSCTLAVMTKPGAPTTFTALDLGTFPNSLTSITVQANAQGEASTVYSASGGVIADAQILAGSPGASGQVKFHVFVTQPVASAK